jgi:hypothetical protein
VYTPPIKITVNPVSAVGTISDPVTVDYGVNSTTLSIGITAPNTIEYWRYSTDQHIYSIVPDSVGKSSIIVTNLTETTYYFATASNGLSQSADSIITSITVRDASDAGNLIGSVVTTGDDTSSHTLSMTNAGLIGNTISWYSSLDNVQFTLINGAASSLSYDVPGSAITTMYYRASSKKGSNSASYTNSVSITIVPAEVGTVLAGLTDITAADTPDVISNFIGTSAQEGVTALDLYTNLKCGFKNIVDIDYRGAAEAGAIDGLLTLHPSGIFTIPLADYMQFTNALTTTDPNLMALDVTVILPSYNKTTKVANYRIEDLLAQAARAAYIQIEMPCGYTLNLMYGSTIVGVLQATLDNSNKVIKLFNKKLNPGDYIKYAIDKKLIICGVGSATLIDVRETYATYPSTVAGVLGYAFSEIQFTASTLTAPIVYSLSATSPALPAGMSLSPGGLLSSPGNLATIYTNTIIVVATDNSTSTHTLTVPVLIYTIPGAPTSVTAVGGSSRATVRWVAPASDGYSAITGYRVYSNSILVGSAGNTATSLVILPLTPGTPYTFTVVAVNAAGESAGMTSPSAVTPIAVAPPSEPTAVVAMSDLNVRSVVSWVGSLSDGGAQVTYVVTSSPGGLIATTTTNSVTFVGLFNNTSYVFSVVATNIAGESEPVLSNVATPRNVTRAQILSNTTIAFLGDGHISL